LLKVIRRLFSFADHQKTHPREPPPGDWLDAQFDEIVDKVDEWDSRVRSAITPDGRVAPGTVTKESLYPAFFADLTAQVLKIAENTLQEAEDRAARAEMAANRADYLKNQAEAAAYRAKHAESELTALKTVMEAQNVAFLAPPAAIQATAATPAVNDDPTESYAGHSEAWARTSMLWAEHMPDILPDDALVGLDITGDHWSSRWWANRADNAFGRLTDLYLGAWPTPPAYNLEGGPIQPGSIYFDTEPPPGQMYVWNGSQWVSMTQPARAGLATLWYNATDGQTVFPFSVMDLNGHNYTLAIDATEGVDAHVNGVKVMPMEVTEGDWTLNAATSTVTFLRPLRAGDVVSFDIMMANEKLGPGAVNAWSLSLTEAKDGTRQTFTLDMEDGAGPAVTVNKNEELVVSLDGVIQEPGVSYSASGSSISFVQAPAADSWVFITWFRSEGGAGVLTGEPVDWADITGKPSTFPPTLPIAQSGVTNLTTDLAAREPTIAAGTSAQYWRGTKTWATLDKAAVGLANVDNTSDANKPVSTAQAAANALGVLKAGDTMTGKLTTAASAAGGSGLNLIPGAAPSAPANGDVWVTASGAFFQINGGTNQMVSIVATQTITGTKTFTTAVTGQAAVRAYSATAIPAGGTAGSGFLVSSATNFGVFFGSGVPTLSAAQGSIYLRSDGTGTNTRVYVNTNGTTGWAAMSVIAVASSAPSSPATNDVWIDTT
jgi:hypothetical protein